MLNNIPVIFNNFIHKYPLEYFSFNFLILVGLLTSLFLNKDNNKIEDLKKLIKKNMDKALIELVNSKPEVINHFLKQDRLSSGDFLKIKEYLARPEQLKIIFNKINNNGSNSGIKAGISIFSTLATQQSIDYLITFLYEKDPEIIRMTIDSLTEIASTSDKVVKTLIEYLHCIPDAKILAHLKKAFLKLGPEAAEELIPLLDTVDPSIKIWIINILGNYSRNDFGRVLLNLLNDNNAEVRITALNNLMKYEMIDITDKIIPCLNDNNWGVRSRAAAALGELKAVEASSMLSEKLRDKSGVVRDTAARALLNLGNTGIKQLIKIAKESSPPAEVIKILKKQNIVTLIKTIENNNENQYKRNFKIS